MEKGGGSVRSPWPRYLFAGAIVCAAVALGTWIFYALSGARQPLDAEALILFCGLLAVVLAAAGALVMLLGRSGR